MNVGKLVCTTSTALVAPGRSSGPRKVNPTTLPLASQSMQIWAPTKDSSGVTKRDAPPASVTVPFECGPVEFAAAASCLKHTVHGDVNLVSFQEVLSLLEGGGSGRIQR